MELRPTIHTYTSTSHRLPIIPANILPIPTAEDGSQNLNLLLIARRQLELQFMISFKSAYNYQNINGPNSRSKSPHSTIHMYSMLVCSFYLVYQFLCHLSQIKDIPTLFPLLHILLFQLQLDMPVLF